MNLIFLLYFTLTGSGAFLLALRYTGNRIAAVWTAVTLAFCPYVLTQSCYFLHFSTIWFFPWFIYLAQRFIDSGKLKYSCLAALVYALCLLEDQTYFFLLSLVAVGIALFGAVIRKKPGAHDDRPRRASLFRRNLLAGAAVFLAISFPYLSALLKETISLSGSFPVWPDAPTDFFSLHPGQLFRPFFLLTIYRNLPFLPLPDALPTNVFCGYIPLFFALFALINYKTLQPEKKAIVLFWLIIGSVFFFIALGPKPFGDIEYVNRLAPYRYVCSGILRQFRIPVRFSLVTMIALYVIASFGVAEFLKQFIAAWPPENPGASESGLAGRNS